MINTGTVSGLSIRLFTPLFIHSLNHCADASNANPTELTLATFCDLSKAFDTINSNTLLHKFNVYGIRGLATKWIECYLSNRTQFVEIESNLSSCLPVQCGVPQGSILGPILFNTYMNDISYSTHENILCFADDTTVYLSDTIHHIFLPEPINA